MKAIHSVRLVVLSFFLGLAPGSLQAQLVNTALGAGALSSNTTGNYNVALGINTLNKNTSGTANTAAGFASLFSNSTGNYNTAFGFGTLQNSTTAVGNTALGLEALYSNTTGSSNTGSGFQALVYNTTGSFNTANGYSALSNNTTGGDNSGFGYQALFSNTTGAENTACGYTALNTNTTGNSNTACGVFALNTNITGNNNTALGRSALEANTTGSNNIAIGYLAGSHSNGDNDILIGNGGVATESNTIRIGDTAVHTKAFVAGINGVTSSGGTAVFIDSSGQLGTVTSSRRFKTDIADMDSASEALLALRPVTFHYKPEIDAARIPQFGLVAEEVAKLNPDLVVRDAKGEIYSVRYEAVNAMLLNEFLKQHRRVTEQSTQNAEQDRRLSAQQKEIDDLKEQLAEIRRQFPKPSLQAENSKP